MSKAISAMVSICLLVGADRAAEYWNRAHAVTGEGTARAAMTELRANPTPNVERSIASNALATTKDNQTNSN